VDLRSELYQQYSDKMNCGVGSRFARWYILKIKILIWVNFEIRNLEKVDIFYGLMEYITAIWYISLPFGIFLGHLVYSLAIWYISWPFGGLVAIWYTYFPPFWYLVSRIIWQPCLVDCDQNRDE
jgi:hypothetical protein